MNPKIDVPNIPDNLSDLTHAIMSLQSKDDYRLGVVSDTVIDNQDAKRVSFEKTMFKNVTVMESSLIGVELTDVVFDKCDLSNVCLTDSFLHRVEFRNCKIIGTDLTRSRFKHVRFVNCMGEFALFRFAKLKHVVFDECVLTSADFSHSQLEKTFFSACRINQAAMTGCKLEGIDLSDCDFDDLIVEIEDLKGCIIAPRHATSFIGLLGVVIK